MGRSIHDDDYRKLIDALKAARMARGLTQQQVADKLKRPQSYVAKIEGRERRLDVIEFVHLCRAMEADPASFFENI